MSLDPKLKVSCNSEDPFQLSVRSKKNLFLAIWHIMEKILLTVQVAMSQIFFYLYSIIKAMSGLLFINMFGIYWHKLMDQPWGQLFGNVLEIDLFLVGTCHWSRDIKGLSSTSTQSYLEFRIYQHWYTHALIIKSCHLASCFVGHMLFAPACLWLLHCNSLCHNCLGQYEQFRTHWHENEEPSLNRFSDF